MLNVKKFIVIRCPKCGLENGSWELVSVDEGFAYVKCNCTTRKYKRTIYVKLIKATKTEKVEET